MDKHYDYYAHAKEESKSLDSFYYATNNPDYNISEEEAMSHLIGNWGLVRAMVGTLSDEEAVNVLWEGPKVIDRMLKAYMLGSETNNGEL